MCCWIGRVMKLSELNFHRAPSFSLISLLCGKAKFPPKMIEAICTYTRHTFDFCIKFATLQYVLTEYILFTMYSCHLHEQTRALTSMCNQWRMQIARSTERGRESAIAWFNPFAGRGATATIALENNNLHSADGGGLNNVHPVWKTHGKGGK